MHLSLNFIFVLSTQVMKVVIFLQALESDAWKLRWWWNKISIILLIVSRWILRIRRIEWEVTETIEISIFSIQKYFKKKFSAFGFKIVFFLLSNIWIRWNSKALLIFCLNKKNIERKDTASFNSFVTKDLNRRMT